MMRNLSVAHRVMVLALSLVALYRLHLLLVVIGMDQVVSGLAQRDGITLAIAVTGLISLLAIPAALSGQWWGLAVGYAVLVINMVFSGPFLLEALAEPYHFAEWAGSLIVLTGNLLGLIFGVIAIVERFGLRIPAWAYAVQERSLRAVAAAVAGMLLLGVTLALTTPPAMGLAEAPDNVLVVELRAMRFQPDQLELATGQRTAVFLINRDDAQHSFDVEGLDVHVSVPAQSSAIAYVQPEADGQFRVYCGIAGHEAAGMVGSLTVQTTPDS